MILRGPEEGMVPDDVLLTVCINDYTIMEITSGVYKIAKSEGKDMNTLDPEMMRYLLSNGFSYSEI